MRKEAMRDENKISRTLDAMQHPEKFSAEELQLLLADDECLQVCRDILDSKEALARKYAPAPDVEEEWTKFLASHPEAKKPSITVKPTRIVRLSVVLTVAASLILIFLLHISGENTYKVFESNTLVQEITINTYQGIHTLSVPRGKKKQIALADGTQVWLNAESSLEYPETFKGQERRVVHLKGEAYFEVAKDTIHPFIVETELLETSVLGTSFNVRTYSPRDTHVTLVEGSVKIKNAKLKDEILMKPGENVTLLENGKLSVSRVEDASAFKSWTKGTFYFDNTELVEIMRELGRWYNIDVIFTNKEAMQYRLHFQADRNSTLPQVLELLNYLQKVNARMENDKIIVSL